jgi:hypothetical protein
LNSSRVSYFPPFAVLDLFILNLRFGILAGIHYKFSTPHIPDGVIAQPSAPLFSSSQAVHLRVAPLKTVGRNANSYAYGKAPLGRRDYLAWVAGHIFFLVVPAGRSHARSIVSSLFGGRLG